MRGPLPQEEFDHIFSRVPRLTVELVIAQTIEASCSRCATSDPAEDSGT